MDINSIAPSANPTPAKTKFSTKEAAEYLDAIGTPFTAGTLEVWRSKGRGPEFIRIRSRIFYTKSALDRFSNGQVVQTIDSRSER